MQSSNQPQVRLARTDSSGVSFASRLQSAWMSPEGMLTVGLWGSAIGGMVAWSIHRRRKRLAKDRSLVPKSKRPSVIHDSDDVSSAAESSKRLQPLSALSAQKNSSALLKQLSKSRSFLNLKNVENDSELESALIEELNIEQKNSLWSLLPRMYHDSSEDRTMRSYLSNTAVLSTMALPCVMLAWLTARNRVKKQNSRMASYLVNQRWDDLFPATVKLALLAIPASILSKGMGFFTSMIELSVNSNLTYYYTKEYLKNNHSYLSKLMLSNLQPSLNNNNDDANDDDEKDESEKDDSQSGSKNDSDNMMVVEGVDYVCERITNDISKLADSYADLVNSFLWSVGGCLTLSMSLIRKMGWKEYTIAILYSAVSRQLISWLNNYSVGYTVLVEAIQKSEAAYHGTHATINEYSEEIAILNGGDIETELLSQLFVQCQNAKFDYQKVSLITECFGNYFTGELGNLVGYLSMVPAVYAGHYLVRGEMTELTDINSNVKKPMDAGDTVEYLTTTVQELAFLTRLFERVFRISKKWSEANGYAHRIIELDKVLNNVVNNDHLNPKSQIIKAEDRIELKNVSIETPFGQRLITDLNLVINQGESLFISGPNGCGKTSIFRIIAGLWSPINGEVYAPVCESKGMFLLSQRPYLVPTLTAREQLTYPEPGSSFATDELESMLEFVGMMQLVRDRGGLDSITAVTGLSGGERQRIGMARCLLHRPRFALLDECSSAVSAEMQAAFFKRCVNDGITLVTIAHEWDLSKYHKRCLKVDSGGQWSLMDLSD